MKHQTPPPRPPQAHTPKPQRSNKELRAKDKRKGKGKRNTYRTRVMRAED